MDESLTLSLASFLGTDFPTFLSGFTAIQKALYFEVFEYCFPISWFFQKTSPLK